MPGDTLSRRRLHLKEKGIPLYNIKRGIFFLGDFFKFAKSGYWFIDSNGKLFTYKKDTRALLRFRKIKNIIPSKYTGSIIEVEGVPHRFKTLYITSPFDKYAGILEYKGMQVLYGTYPQQYRDTWRMV